MAKANPNSESLIILSSDDDLIVEKSIMTGASSSNPSSSVTRAKQKKKKTKKKETLFLPGKYCFICKKSSHRVKYCPERSSWGTQSTKICLNCGDVGHEMFSCKSIYSPDDLKEVQCYVCKCFGHLCCVNYAIEGSTEVSCYRCGQLGHSGWECAKVHAETGSEWTPSSCYVCRKESHTACKCIGHTHPKKVKRKRDPSIPEEKEKEKEKIQKMLEKKNEKDSMGKCGNDLGARSMPQPNPRGRGNWMTEHPPAYNHNYNHRWGYPMVTPMYISSDRFQSNPDMFHAAGYNGYQHRFSASRFARLTSFRASKLAFR